MADPVSPRDASGRKRVSPIWIVGAGIFLILYVGVNLLYGRSTARPELPPVSSGDRVVVYLNPIALVPSEDRIKSKVIVNPPLDYFTGKKLNRTLNVVLASERQTLTYKEGTTALSSDVEIIAGDGSYEMYPFDSYENGMAVYATVVGDDGAEQVVPTELVIWGKFAGWRVHPTTSVDPLPAGWVIDEETRAKLQDESVAVLEVSRNGSTMSIVMLLLGAMIVLTVLALVVARAVATRRRRIEATMASWFAALLFAMVPLRTNMPGAPPIGVWIDFLVFLWVVLGLMLALAVFIGSWLRYSAPPQ